MRWQLLPAAACLGLSLQAQAQTAPAAGEPSSATTMAEAAKADNLEILQTGPGQALRKRFLSENPGARQHQFGLQSPDPNGPALRLNTIWAGPKGTLVSLSGLPRPGKLNSSVMRRDTLALADPSGYVRARLKDVAGAKELRDPRGGSAIMINPGDEVYLLFEPMDDYQPFRLQHSVNDGSGDFDYFGTLDPRFRDRYDNAYNAATTPEKMTEFITGFAANDPDNRVREVFVRLIGLMRQQNTFEGYYNAYLLLQEVDDLRQASRLARTSEHQAKIENMAVATLVDKSRLIDFTLSPDRTSTSEAEGSCWIRCQYNFSSSRAVKGSLSVRLNPKSPIKLAQGHYRLTLNATLFVPRHENRRGDFWSGNYDGPSNQEKTTPIVIELHPPLYQATVRYDLGEAILAFFERSMTWEYYKSVWSVGDPQVTFSYQSMELIP